MTTAEKIAYLKGILDASHITDSTQKKIYESIVDVLDSLAEDVEFNTENIDNIDSRLSEVDEDLELVESILYEDDLDEGFEEDDEDYEGEEDFDPEAFLDDMDFEEDELDEDLEDDIDEDIDDEAEDDAAIEEDEFDEPDDDELLEEEEGEQMYEIECPACHETIYLQESVILEGGVDCPNCGEPLEFDIEFEEE